MDARPAAMTRDQLAREAGVLTWPELQRHFARGVVIVVTASLDWLEVALAMTQDDAGRLAEWMGQGAVFKANDECARRWSVDQTPLRAIVVAPWVLVQEVRPMRSIPATPIH